MNCAITIIFVFLVNQSLVSADFKVINGTRAIMHEYPQLVSIRISGEHQCGATLLNRNTILTAAHCVWDMRDWPRNYLQYYQVQVVLGEYDLHRVYGYEKYFQVTRIIIPKAYTSSMGFVYGDDIALLKIDGSIGNDQYDYIKYTILDTNSISRPGSRCEIVGWGSLSPSGIGSSQYLQKAFINIVSNEDCSRAFDNVRYVKGNICAGSGRMSTSACRGDSGGPLFCTDGYNRHIQVGIVSYGSVPCGQPNAPTVFTRVSEYIQWIAQNSL